MGNLPALLVKNFIQRRDVKAVQLSTGDYMPHTVNNRRDGERIPWRGRDLHEHLMRISSFGHYMLDTESRCKLFAFDIDLEPTGFLPASCDVESNWPSDFTEANPREAWRDRRHVARPWLKYQMRMLAGKLAGVAYRELDLKVAVAYSGCKGLHVYCFHEPMAAADSREGAQLVIDTLGELELKKGHNFYKHQDTDPYTGYSNLSVEVFPKQTDLTGKDLGNLMRLPLGINRKTNDPTFFVDLTAAMNELKPGDAETILASGNPWLSV